MRNAGIEVITGVLNKESRDLNKRFFTFHEKKRPYIILKWAQSKDGFISRTLNDIKKGKNNWITGEKSIEYVHKQRAYEQAILIGSNTVKIDNPLLTTRGIDGKSPLRVVITSQPLVNRDLNILKDHLPTLIFNKKLNKKEGNKEWIQFDGALKSVLQNSSWFMSVKCNSMLGFRTREANLVQIRCKISVTIQFQIEFFL